MSHRTTVPDRQQALVAEMTQRVMTLVQELSGWLTDQPYSLAALEQQVLRASKELAAALLSQLVPLLLPVYDPADLPCSCGGVARYQRDRPAQVTTLLDPITLTRPYYHCGGCGQGFAPLDRQLQVCAGSVSGGLEELLALLAPKLTRSRPPYPFWKSSLCCVWHPTLSAPPPSDWVRSLRRSNSKN